MTTAAASFNYKKYLAFKYLPSWIIIAFIKLISFLPWRLQQFVGANLGVVFYYLLKMRSRVIAINLKLCYPQQSASWRDKLIKENFKAMGRAVAELGFFWYASDEEFLKRSRVYGLEHFEAATKKGNVLLLGVHFTPLEAAVRYLNTLGMQLKGMYKPAKDELFEAYMTHRRNIIYRGAMIPNSRSEQFTQALQKGDICWFAPDQSFHTHVVYAPLFGIECASLVSASALCAVGKAQLLPCFGVLNKEKTAYDIHILPPLENFPSTDAVRDATMVNKAIETMINYAPEQYLWGHKRFKDIKGAPNPYPTKTKGKQ